MKKEVKLALLEIMWVFSLLLHVKIRSVFLHWFHFTSLHSIVLFFIKNLFFKLFRNLFVSHPCFVLLQPIWSVQLSPHHWLCWGQCVIQEEPPPVSHALQELARCQAGFTGQWGAAGTHTSKLQQHSNRSQAGETCKSNMRVSNLAAGLTSKQQETD